MINGSMQGCVRACVCACVCALRERERPTNQTRIEGPERVLSSWISNDDCAAVMVPWPLIGWFASGVGSAAAANANNNATTTAAAAVPKRREDDDDDDVKRAIAQE